MLCVDIDGLPSQNRPTDYDQVLFLCVRGGIHNNKKVLGYLQLAQGRLNAL